LVSPLKGYERVGSVAGPGARVKKPGSGARVRRLIGESWAFGDMSAVVTKTRSLSGAMRINAHTSFFKVSVYSFDN